jgi:hypothetical protein
VRGLLVVLVLVAVGLGGCAKRSGAVGAGPDIDACAAYKEYDADFGEPPPTDPDAILAYAQGVARVVDRVRDDYTISVKNKEDLVPPKEVIDAFAQVKVAMTDLGQRVRAAGKDPVKVKDAANWLATNRAYLQADARISDFYATTCPHGQ